MIEKSRVPFPTEQTPDETLKELVEIAHGTRRIFEVVLKASLGSTDTKNTCLYGAFLLLNSILQFTPLSARICGGGDGVAGYRDANGVLHGHYWVEASDGSGRAWAVDVTADQFGSPPVQVLALPAARDIYVPGDQQEVDDAVASIDLPTHRRHR